MIAVEQRHEPPPGQPERQHGPAGRPTAALRVVAALTLALAVALTGSPLPIAALVAVGLCVAVLARPEWATLLFLFTVYLNVPAVATRFHGVPSIVASGSVLILGVPIAAYLVLRRESLVVTPALPLMFLYLAALMASTVLSVRPESSLPFISTFLSEGLLLFLLVSNCIRSSAMIRKVIWVLILAGSLMGALSIYQEVTGSYGNDLGGFAQVVTQGFKIDESATEGKVLRGRLAGPIGEQNRYAQILLPVVALAIFRLWGERSRALRLAATVAALLMLAGILLSFSRGAFVAASLVLLTLVVLREARLRHVAVIAVVVVVTIFAVAPDYLIRITSLQGVEGLANDGEGADGAMIGRVTSNLAAWNTFVDHPVLGVGPLQYFEEHSLTAANELDLRRFDQGRRAHNLYLEIAADTGVVGLSAFLAIVGSTMVELLRLRTVFRRRRPDLANLATSFFVALVAYLACGLFLHLSYQRYYWLLVALSASVVWVLRSERDRTPVATGGETGVPVATG